MAGLFLVVGAAGCATSEASPARHEEEVAPSASAEHQEPGAHASASGSAHGPVHADHPWAYTGDKGPTNWGDLDPKWEQCEVGKNQSPIDLPAVGDEPHGVDKLSVDYMAVPLRVKHNGHTVEVQNRTDSFITIGNKRFDLLQFHFHSPSEHTVAGQRFPLEVHFVNKARDGELAVVGVLFETGDFNKTLEEVWKRMPKSETQDYVNHEKRLVNVADLISPTEGYYHYPGSLTTPPCGEGVRWFVMKETRDIEQRAVDLFRAVIGGRSNRPVQPIGARKVFFFTP